MNEKNKKSFEESLNRLEDIADQLESGDVDLDETMALYEEATSLAKWCHEKLSKAEEKIYKLSKENETFNVTELE